MIKFIKRRPVWFLLCILGFTSCSEKIPEKRSNRQSEAVSSSPLAQESILLLGVYRGKNLYIQNPMSEDGYSCVETISINGEPNTFQPEDFSSAFEISLSDQGLILGDSFFVRIEHGAYCTPKILNPESF